MDSWLFVDGRMVLDARKKTWSEREQSTAFHSFEGRMHSSVSVISSFVNLDSLAALTVATSVNTDRASEYDRVP